MGVVLGAVGVVAGLLGAGLHAANAAAGRTSEPSFWLMGFAASLAYGLGSVLLRRSDATVLRNLMGAVALAQGGSLLLQEYAFLGTAVPGREWSLWLGSWCWAPGYVAIAALLPLLLPEGRLPSPRWWPALVLSTATLLVVSVSWALTPYDAQDFPEPFAGARNPVAVEAMGDPVVWVVGGSALVVAVLVAFTSLVVRWQGAVDVQRQQLKWVLLGYAGTVLLFGLAQVLPVATTEVVAGLAMVPLPAAIGVAVLRHGLWEVDVVISRSLVYGLLSAVVAGVYAATVWFLGEVLGESTGAPIVATTVIALLALPARTWLQRHVNRWVHGDAEEPYAVLARLGDRLGSVAAPDELVERVLPSVVEQVARSLRAQEARLALGDGTVASYGGGAGEEVAVDLVYAGERLGVLAVRRSAGFDDADVRALDRLAAQAAVAAHTVLLSREAQRAREAVVLAREEERRRLRRDLHDGVGPSLAALALHAETARDLAAEDPAAAVAVLDRLVPRLNAAVADVRALVHELRPPTLDELGLVTAVHALADRLSTGRTRVVAEVDALPELPAAVEVAAYHLVGEAAGNAVRHSGASVVRVRIVAGHDALEVTVADDGTGLPQAAPTGLGMTTMRERAEELGGRFTLHSDDDGTLVTATLPFAPVPVGAA